MTRANAVLRILLLLMLGSWAIYAGETGKISGTITDAATGETLPGANVVVSAKWIGGNEVPINLALGASTDLDGTFFILNIPPGLYSVTASFIGYTTLTRTQVQVQVDKTTRVSFELSSDAIAGDEEIVLAYLPEAVEKDVTATRVNYNIEEISDLPGITDVGDILSLQADVDNGHFRGSRTGEAAYLVNGASIVNPLNNSSSFSPITIGLQQVEVYTSGFSAEYGNVQSGVINMVAKEGRSDKWETKFDMSSTNSYYKTFGGSVFATEYNDYFEQMNNTEEWAFGTDPISGVLLWSHFGLGFDRYLPDAPIVFPPQPISREDSLRTAELVRILWLQSVRQIGLEYDKPDYRVEFSTSGPIGDKATLFLAAQQQIVQPFLPTGRSNVARQLATNVTFKPNETNKIQVVYNFDNGFNNGITNNFYRWFENILNVTKNENRTHQFGLNWNRSLSKSTILDVKLSQLITSEKEMVDLLGDSTFSDLYGNSTNWRDYTAPNGYQVGKMQTTTGIEETRTFTLNTNLSSQLNRYNLLKTGIQFSYYDLNVDYLRSRSNAGQARLEKYDANPYEGAIYVQDKLEFEGFIANLGMRLDFYDLNTVSYNDKFSPYRNPNYDPLDASTGGQFDPEFADRQDTRLKTYLQPRIGVSFPVSEKAVLHFNYGVFTQRPSFERTLGNRFALSGSPGYEQLGNPELEPEYSIAYDVGLVYGLPLGLYLDVSSYLKDVSNLLQFASYTDLSGNRYFTFDNKEYANIKGFQVNLEKKSGTLSGSIRYNWESATGKSGSAVGSGARSQFIEGSEPLVLPPKEDVFLDYNRKHKLVGNARIKTGDATGFEIVGVRPLARLAISGSYRLSSGRPFTYDISGQGLQFNRRTPTEHNLKIRLDKQLHINGSKAKIYFEIFNVTNHKIFDYGNTFEDDLGSQNPFKVRFVEDRENLLTNPDFAPFFTSMDAYLYDNQPRHYRLGLELGF